MESWRTSIEKEFGDTIFQGRYVGEVVPTGSFILDYLTEVGGVPVGRLSEVFGEEGSGKTTVALSMMLQCIEQGRPVLFEDFEATLTDSVMKKMGIDPKLLENYRVIPKTMEDGWRLAERFLERPEHKGGMIFVDSLAAMPTKTEIEDGVTGSIRIGLIAQVMANSLRQITAKLAKANVGLVFVNQERASINLKLGGGKTTPGGKALRFYASLRVHLRLKGSITVSMLSPLDGKKKDEVTAIRVGLKVVKNKFGRSYRNGEMVIRMNGGIDNIYSAAKIGELAGMIKKRGAYYIMDAATYGRKDDLGEIKRLGYERLRDYFIQNPKIWYKFMDDVKQHLN